MSPLASRDMTFFVTSSVIIALLTLLTSVVSLLFSRDIYPTEELWLSFLPTDVINLLLTVPLTMFLVYKIRGNNVNAILGLFGLLWYNMYIYVMYTIGCPVNMLLTVYLAIICLSAYTLIGLLITLDHESILSYYQPNVSRLYLSTVLILVGVAFLTRQIVEMVDFQIHHRVVTPILTGQWFSDFVVFAVPMVLGGYLLWRQNAIGFTLAPGLFLGSSLAFIGLVPFLMIQALLHSTTVNWFDMLFVTVFGLPLMIPYLKYYRP